MRQVLFLVPIVLSGALCPAQSAPDATGGSAPKTGSIAYSINGQATFIGQTLLPFRSPYAGPMSLPSHTVTDWTQTYTVYLGVRPTHGLELYVDPEWALGQGVGGGTGVAAYPNGDVLRIPAPGLPGASPVPYLARAFVRWTVATNHGEASVVQQQNQVQGELPAHRLVLTAGKLSTTDLFDTNSYANSTRTQFLNWALINDPAYDYAADLRGYSVGGAVEWIHPTWAIRAGSFAMPTFANGPVLGSIFAQSRGDQVEVEDRRKLFRLPDPAVLKLLAYRNVADMGTYREALAMGSPPNIVATREPETVKYGFGFNAEQALGDDGDTGGFVRAGWNDAATETFAYTECDVSVSGGLQVSGRRWRLPQDRAAIAVAVDGLSAAHREYLAAGGAGFLLGDGRLRYGQEQLLEAYYSHHIAKGLAATADLQVLQNPGYNRDRGPAPLVSFRLHWEF